VAYTFATMKTLVADYLNRTDITDAQIGVFLNAAMRTLENGQFTINGIMMSHNWLAMQKRQYTTGTATAGVPDTNLVFPVRIKEVEFLKLFDTDDDQWYDLEPKDPATALSLYPFGSSVQDQPSVFAPFFAQSQILLRPNPDELYTYDCLFYAFTPEMVNAGDHNAWTDYHWEILLHGALVQASPFLRDDPRIATWRDLYTCETNAQIAQEREQKIAGGLLIINAFMPNQLVGGRRFDINAIT
jgi:hypothetical protein